MVSTSFGTSTDFRYSMEVLNLILLRLKAQLVWCAKVRWRPGPHESEASKAVKRRLSIAANDFSTTLMLGAFYKSYD
eukprot:TRINITY_DN704_c0_g1_i1.p2 TRINITY_DN704_c0_g1~~TRINITY_DN704_c0_g1_i1.p2  ORF type:complete len:77 (+),score=2.47 TRINITY_DN704_c0_g1_i1:199-429(+)